MALKADFPAENVEVQFVTNDYPATNDKLTNKKGSHSAAFISEFAANPSRALAEWRETRWGSFVEELRSGSGIEEATFEVFLKSLRLVTGDASNFIRVHQLSLGAQRSAQEIASLLPRLVADDRDKDRWSRQELLTELKWHDSFGLHFLHQFPIGAYVQRNAKTEKALRAAIEGSDRGYLALVGPPGSGKSTLLQSAVMTSQDLIAVRYLAFVPGGGQGLGRGEAEGFLDDINSQLKGSGLFGRFRQTTLAEKREQFGSLLVQAGERFSKEGVRTLVIVDGLDHVPREEHPERSLLAELPLPSAIPKGVLILLGTQRLELPELAGAVREQAAFGDRCIKMDPLSPEAVYRISEALGLETDICSQVFELTDGHPLVAHYLVEALRAASKSEREKMLSGEISFKGDLESVYASAWRGVENDDNARDVLGYIARAEGAIEPELLAKVTSDSAVEKALRATRHLLRIEGNAWSVFHNSFRLFILSKPRLRFDKPDVAYSASIYRQLAELAVGAPASSQQRWLELRYFARAQDYHRVLDLAQPVRFRAQLAAGRSAKDIQADIGLSFTAVKGTGDAVSLFCLLLARDEIERRATALSYAQGVVEALLAVGDLEAAAAYAESYDRDQYKIVDALLDDGRTDRARALFDRLELLHIFSSAGADRTNESEWKEWARRVHYFREADQIEETLKRAAAEQSRLQRIEGENDSLAETLRFEIGLSVATNTLPGEIDSALQVLSVAQNEMPYFLIQAAAHTLESGNTTSGRALLMQAIAHEAFPRIASNWRRAACNLAIVQGEIETANAIFSALKASGVATLDRRYDEDSPKDVAEAMIEYAEMGTLLGATLLEPTPSENATLRPLQIHATRIGTLLGRFQAGRSVPAGEVFQTAREALAYLERAGPGKASEYNTMMQLSVSARVLQREILRAAARHSEAEFERVVVLFDEMYDRAANPRISNLWMRREFVLEYYRWSEDADGACRRLEPLLNEIVEQTPEGQIDELAQLAKAYARVGKPDLARNLLLRIQEETLGNALPPKKDPQYRLWLALLLRANAADPAGRRDRVAFMIRQLDGMAQTEGDGSAFRIAADVLMEASRIDAANGYAAAQVLGEQSLQPWCNLLNAVLSALVDRRQDLAWPCAMTWAALVLPYYVETRFYRPESSGDFIKSVMTAGKGSVELTGYLLHAIESESQAEMRCALLDRLRSAIEQRNPWSSELHDALSRWRAELPDEGDGTTPGAYDDVDTLEALNDRIATVKKELSYEVPHAYERLVSSADLTTARKMFESFPELQASNTARFAFIERALTAGDRELARSLLEGYRVDEDKYVTWGSYMGGVRRHYFDLRSRVTGEVLHQVAYEDLAGELAAGREGAGSVLVDFDAVVPVITGVPEWDKLWKGLAGQIRVTREHAFGKPFSVAANGPQTDEQLLTALYRWALSLAAIDVTHHVRTGALALASVEAGQPIFAALTREFLDGNDDEKIESLQLMLADTSESAREGAQEQVIGLIGHMDYAIAVAAARLCERWGVDTTLPTNELPPFYRLQLPPRDASRNARVFAGAANEEVRLDDPVGWQQMFEGFEERIARASGIPAQRIRDRALMLLNQWGGIDRFGEASIEQVESTLKKLSMRIIYVKPAADAAARAFRHVAGELRLAGRMDREAEPFLMQAMGYPTVPFPKQPPAARPAFLRQPSLGSSWSERSEGWLSAVENDVLPLLQDGATVLAEVTRFEARKTRTTYTLDRVRGHELSIDAAGDPKLWPYNFLSAVWLEGTSLPASRERAKTIARCLSVSQRPDMPTHVLVICPHWLEHLKWRLHPRNPFIYMDRAGHVMARMIWWRDGAPLDIDADVSWGEGTLLILTRSGRGQVEREKGKLAISVHAKSNIKPPKGSGEKALARYATSMELA
jgi:hypothetical protein